MQVGQSISVLLAVICAPGRAMAQEPGPQPSTPATATTAETRPAPTVTPGPGPAATDTSIPLDMAAPPAASREQQAPETELPRETPIENPLERSRAISGSGFGGYGELTLNAPSNGPAIVDMRRFVLYFGHHFTENIRFYSEFEVEHAISSSTDQGEAEVEQAYLDGLVSRRVNLRGGVIIVPVGIVNVYHEPPSFNGVDRPDVDQFVIPTTWREAGFGIFGELAEGLRYQLYVVNGFNANGFTAELALRDGQQEAQLARARDFGGVLRLDCEPVLGTVLGFSAYSATSGNTLRDTVGRVPVSIFEADARTRHGGFTARAEIAFLFIGDAAALSRAFAAGDAEQVAAGPISSQSRGAYLEAAYDVLRLASPGAEQSLTAFGRFDYADTQARVPSEFSARLEFRRYSGVFGLVWRPIPQIAIKADYRRRAFGSGPGVNEGAAAITWLF